MTSLKSGMVWPVELAVGLRKKCTYHTDTLCEEEAEMEGLCADRHEGCGIELAHSPTMQLPHGVILVSIFFVIRFCTFTT